jgi:hypothetical protein
MAFYQVENQSFQIFYLDETMCEEWNENVEYEDDEYETGFYYHFCLPGCLPDSFAYGPYATEQDCYNEVVKFLEFA